MCKTTHQEEKKCEFDERVVWETMMPLAWHNSITKDSIFCETYKATRQQIVKTAESGGHDVIVEVGCGTGDIIGELDTSIPCYGLDINPEFIRFCDENHPHDHCDFLVQDACKLSDWWAELGGKFKKPLVICVNNTLNIMPEEIRGNIVAQMITVAGKDGRCLISYWNGNFFSHALMNYYKVNPTLCGTFSMEHVDFDERMLVTPTGYSTHWLKPVEVQQLLRAHDVDVDVISHGEPMYGKDHMNTQGLSIFVWFSEACTSRAKGYYDSDDAQKFYNDIWGEETIHIGRYDLLTEQDLATLPKQAQIARAQELHELEFLKLIHEKFPDQKQVRVLDMGCGYGGLLRRLWKAGIIWSGTGVDIAAKMCAQNRRLNVVYGCDKDITVLEESYLDVSVENECVDLVISMDALLHVGPERQRKAIREAARVLRPGGWMLFTDILQQEVVDPIEMQPIYDRIHLSKLGTVSNYKSAMDAVGFGKFEFLPHSSNVSAHYGTVREVLIEKGDSVGVSEEYAKKMEAGLRTWRDLAPKNILWGFVAAQKTDKVYLD